MKKWILFAYLGLAATLATAQTATLQWAKKMGGTADETGLAIAVDAAGNVYTVGWFEGTADFDPGPGTSNIAAWGPTDMYISKLDAAGNFVWAKRIGGNGEDLATGISADNLGHLYITGQFSVTTDFDPGAGVYNLTSLGGVDIFVMKLDTAGNFIWAKQAGGVAYDGGNAIATNATSVYVTGYFADTVDFDPGAGVNNLVADGNMGASDIFVLKLDTAGNMTWAKSMGGGRRDEGMGITTDAADNVYTCGGFVLGADFDPGPGTYLLSASGPDVGDAFVLKLDANGNFVWAKKAGGSSGDEATAITLDNWGNVYTCGYFTHAVNFNTDPGGNSVLTSGIGTDIFVLKLTAAGTFAWAKNMGGTNDDFGIGVAADAAGNVYTTGYFGYGTAADFDPGTGICSFQCLGDGAFISKLDSSGNFVLAENLQGADSGSNYGHAIVLDAAGNIYSTGSFYHNSDFDPGTGHYILTGSGGYDAYVHKMSQEPLTVSSIIAASQLFIYPNPGDDIFYVSMSPKPNEAVLEVYNNAGTLMKREAVTKNLTAINLSNAASGVYFVRLVNKGGTAGTQKLIKR